MEEIIVRFPDISVAAACKKLELNRKTVYNWGSGIYVPDAQGLQKLLLGGCDVRYILTGKRWKVAKNRHTGETAGTIGERALQEVNRRFRGASAERIGKILHIRPNFAQNWAEGHAPDTYAITALLYAGCDVEYILTGCVAIECD
jgi:hypothetical protein